MVRMETFWFRVVEALKAEKARVHVVALVLEKPGESEVDEEGDDNEPFECLMRLDDDDDEAGRQVKPRGCSQR